jgi:hypothetical protein
MCGGAIYVAAAEAIAKDKSADDGRRQDDVIRAKVDLGKAAVLESPCRGMTQDILRRWGCNSLRGRAKPDSDWEYVIFDSERVRLLSMTSNAVVICKR